jgi:hypothetical protein
VEVLGDTTECTADPSLVFSTLRLKTGFQKKKSGQDRIGFLVFLYSLKNPALVMQRIADAGYRVIH